MFRINGNVADDFNSHLAKRGGDYDYKGISLSGATLYCLYNTSRNSVFHLHIKWNQNDLALFRKYNSLDLQIWPYFSYDPRYTIKYSGYKKFGGSQLR